jgi:hypothetical protein
MTPQEVGAGSVVDRRSFEHETQPLEYEVIASTLAGIRRGLIAHQPVTVYRVMAAPPGSRGREGASRRTGPGKRWASLRVARRRSASRWIDRK